MEKNVTDEVREANGSTARPPPGRSPRAGKKQSSMNALKHGRYAKRLDPMKRLLEELRARRYAPPCVA